MMAKKNSYCAWKLPHHVEHFDHRMFYPRFFLKQNFESFNEIKMLKKIKQRKDIFSLLDIGCATGEFSRYFRYQFPKLKYTGCDISEVAIHRAREKFPNERYSVIDETISQLAVEQADIVFCRDVILHQPDPFHFLKKICEIQSKSIIMRLRTRDVGETVLDTERSCQLNYGKWAPYIILNCDEIVSFLNQNCPSVFRITFVKHYMPLGGKYLRFVPKDCYLENTKTAETALLIEKNNQNNAKIDVKNMIKPETCGPMLAAKVSAKVLHFLYRYSKDKRVWW